MKSSSSEESALTFYTDTVTIKLILTGKIQTIKDSSLRTKKPDWNDRLARNQRRVQPEKPPVTPSSSENEVGPLCVCVCVVCVCVCLFISWNGTPFRCGSLAASFSFQRSRRCQARPPKNRRRRCHRRPTSLSINRAPFPFDRHYISLSLSLSLVFALRMRRPLWKRRTTLSLAIVAMETDPTDRRWSASAKITKSFDPREPNGRKRTSPLKRFAIVGSRSASLNGRQIGSEKIYLWQVSWPARLLIGWPNLSKSQTSHAFILSIHGTE